MIVVAAMAESGDRDACIDVTAVDLFAAVLGVLAAGALVGASVRGLVGLVVWRERGVDVDDVGSIRCRTRRVR